MNPAYGNLYEFYQNLLTSQASWFASLVSLILVVAGVFLGYQWYWNIHSSKKQISSEIENQVKKALGVLEKNNEKKMRNIFADLEAKVHKDIFFETKRLEADLSRSFALISEDSKLYITSFDWLMNALSCYQKINNQKGVGRTTRWAATLIANPDFLKQDDDDKDYDYQKLIQIARQDIPDYLEDEKKKIINVIKKLEESQKTK